MIFRSPIRALAIVFINVQERDPSGWIRQPFGVSLIGIINQVNPHKGQ
jgi:hypothetical protein